MYLDNINFDYYSVERKAFWDFWYDNEDALHGVQDHRPCPSETIDFTLNKSFSSEID